MTSDIGGGSGPAIVTTLRDAGCLLDSFVAYHLGIGFSRLYLFFDDPADPDLRRVADWPGVTAIACDDAERSRWRSSSLWPALGGSIDQEVMARQILNASLALKRARSEGHDWLLHIDVDELFWSPGRTAAEHFALLANEPFDVISYPNFEAVPEADDVVDPFREVTLFKAPLGRLKRLPPERLERARALDRRFEASVFNLYSNGKSAVRVGAPELEPMGVHTFAHPSRRTPFATSAQDFILHYACCGFETFLAKYRRLGRFGDAWWNRYDIATAIGPFHLQARDVVLSGDRDAALAFYRRRVSMQDPVTTDAVLATQVLERVREPAERLARQKSTARPFFSQSP